MDKVKIYINGKEHEANKGETVLKVCRENGYDIPTLCYHDQLEPFGSCFLCTVEIEGGKKKYSLSCGTTVFEGMKIKTDTEEIWKQRKMALELLMSNHYADCVGPCLITCPSNIDIQGYIAAVAEGDYTKAISIIKNDNPFPAVCGRVCTRPCEDECRRNLVDSKVGIDYLKRYAADKDIASKHKYTASAKEPNGKKIAVIGGGPSGLSAAYYLALEGYKVEVFEQYSKAGGMLRYGIPKYRLPHDVLDTEIESITDLGVVIHTGKKLGMDFSLEDLKAKKFDALYLAIGAHECMFMGIEGEDAEGVFGGIGFLRDTVEGKKINLGKNVIVIGGGNTAIDAARVSVRSGAENVTMVYRRTVKEMPAHESEIEDAVAEGIKIAFLTNPTRVIKDASGHVTKLECIKMELGEPDASGRRSPRPVKGSEFTIDADTVIFAIGQKSELKCVESKPGTMTENLKFTKWQTISADEKNFQTDEPGVFAGGDFRRGPDTVIGSIADGKKAAWVMNKYILTGEILDYPEEFFSRKDNLVRQIPEMYKSLEKIEKVEMPKLDAGKRKDSYEEVETGFTCEMASKEASRCLECGCKSVFDCELKDSSNAYSVKQDAYKGAIIDKEPDKRHPYIVFEPNKCINCGRCIRMCGEVVGLSVLGFVNRGFETLIRPPFDKSLQETDCISCGLCADACPTGAIVIKTDTLKGPMEFAGSESLCTDCSFGCELECDSMSGRIVNVRGKASSEINKFGNICKLGRFSFRDANRNSAAKLPKSDMDKSLKKVKEHLDSLKDGEAAFYIGENTSLEEAFLLTKIASHYKFSFVGSAKSYSFTSVSDADIETLRNSDSIFIIGADPYGEFPMVMPEIMKAKRKGSKLSYIGVKDKKIKRNSDMYAELSGNASIDEFVGCMLSYMIKEKGLKSSEKGFDVLEKRAGECKGKCCSGSEFAEELLNAANPIIITSGDSLVSGVFASISNLLNLMGRKKSLLIFGESANSAGFTLMGLNRKHSGLKAKAVYYNVASDAVLKDGFLFGYRKSGMKDFVRINAPFSQKGTYVNAFNNIQTAEKAAEDLEYSNVDLLISLLNMVSGGKYDTAAFEKEFEAEMKVLSSKLKDGRAGGFIFSDAIKEKAEKTDGFREAEKDLLQ